MNKRMIILSLFLVGIMPLSKNLQIFHEHIGDNNQPIYETWGNELSNDELVSYYKKNNIYLANKSREAPLYDYKVLSHLSEKFDGYTSWYVTSKFEVKDIYGNNPREMFEYHKTTSAAKSNAGIINDDFVGCGPLALLCQLTYLSDHAGYLTIANNSDNVKGEDAFDAPCYVDLATEVFEKTETISFGEEGTYSWPSSIIDSSLNILENHNLAHKDKVERIDENGNIATSYHFSENSSIYVYGDKAFNESSKTTKINNIIDSIDRGMPVIWWAFSFDKSNPYGNHYMNIYGYEYWCGTNDDGDKIEHLMFKLRMNWGIAEEVYVDSDILTNTRGGFIYFKENNQHTTIRSSNYEYACQYYFEEKSKTITPFVGNDFNTDYLRAGYVNRYNETNTSILDQQISLSAKREGAGVAYIDYLFNDPVGWMYIELSWWSDNEQIGHENGLAHIQYFDHLNTWKMENDLINSSLSIDIDEPSLYLIKFKCPVKRFRIYEETSQPSGDRNKGRVVIGDMMLMHDNKDYKTYVPNNGITHTVTCICGQEFSQTHYFSPSDSSGRYVTCKECGYKADTYDDIIPGIIY